MTPGSRKQDKIRPRFLAILTAILGSALLPLAMAIGQVQVAPEGASTNTAAPNSENRAQPAPQSPVGGPVLGYTLDSRSGLVLPLWGLPGAASFGPGLDLGLEAKSLQLNSAAGFALAIDGEEGRVAVIGMEAGAVPRLLPDVKPGIDRIVMSPAGSAAALYDRQRSSVQIVTGLPRGPRKSFAADLSQVPGFLLALAVNDAGDQVLAAVTESQRSGVYAMSADGNVRFIAAAERIAAMAFLPGSSDLLFVDGARDEVTFARSRDGGYQLEVIASSRDGIRGARAVAADASHRRVFIAITSPGAVVEIDLETRVSGMVLCRCQPTILKPLRVASTFQLTPDPRQPLFVLDATRESSRIVFIPAAGNAPAGPPKRPPRRGRAR